MFKLKFQLQTNGFKFFNYQNLSNKIIIKLNNKPVIETGNKRIKFQNCFFRREIHSPAFLIQLKELSSKDPY